MKRGLKKVYSFQKITELKQGTKDEQIQFTTKHLSYAHIDHSFLKIFHFAGAKKI